MRFVVLPIASLMLIGATDTNTTTRHADSVIDEVQVVQEKPQIALSENLPNECRDRVRQADPKTDQAVIERKPATTEKSMMIWAVDRRENGCGVMVMKGDLNDVREVPARPENIAGLIPADAAQ